MSSLLVATPTYNERDNLPQFVEAVFAVAPQAHLLIVDDASPDGTGELAESIAAKDPRVHVLHRTAKLGIGTAYLEAFRWALARNYELICEMDADLSHDPRYLPELVKAIDAGADIATGSRNIKGGDVEGWGPLRHFISKGGSLYARLILGMRLRDLTTGYKMFRRSSLQQLKLDEVHSDGYAFQIEISYRATRRGLRIVEIPIVFVDRRAGKSKMSGRIFSEAAWMMWKLRLQASRGRL